MRGQFAERDGRNRRGAFARSTIHAGEGKSESKRQPERSECSHMRHKRHPTVELTRRREFKLGIAGRIKLRKHAPARVQRFVRRRFILILAFFNPAKLPRTLSGWYATRQFFLRQHSLQIAIPIGSSLRVHPSPCAAVV